MNSPSLPQISGQRAVKALEKVGFIIRRQRGIHVILVHSQDLTQRVVIPLHGSKSIKPGTLRAILKGANLSVEDFKELLK